MDVNNLALQVSNFATVGAQHAWALVGNFLALLVLTVVMILFSYRAGRGGIISLVIALYAGYGIFLVFPYTSFVIGLGSSTLIKAVLSIVLYIAATIVPFIFAQRLTHGGIGVLSFVPRFALSFLTAAFILAIAYHVFDLNHLYSFPKPLDQLFAPNQYFFWWFIAPLAGLFFLVH
jgi:hypothetical protein